MPEEDSAAGAALLQTAAHALDFDGERSMVQALHEFAIFPGRKTASTPDIEGRADVGQPDFWTTFWCAHQERHDVVVIVVADRQINPRNRVDA